MWGIDLREIVRPVLGVRRLGKEVDDFVSMLTSRLGDFWWEGAYGPG
jgi:hypothetical protein